MDAIATIHPEIENYEDEERPDVRGLWTPATIADVDWALSRLARCEEEVAQVDAQEAAAIAAIQTRAEQLRKQARVGVAYFELRLVGWAEQHKDEIVRGRAKSRGFIYGRVGFRAAGGRLKVVDKDALELWLLAQPPEKGLYRMKVEPEMRALQALCKAAGEIPPGCDYEPEREDLHIKAELPGTALAKKE